MIKDIQHRYFFSRPPEMVWEYLTIPELMEQWLMPNNFLPIMGYDFEFRIKRMPQLAFDGIIYCKVLEVVPYKKLSYSWKCGPGNGKITVDSIVVWSLQPRDKGTELLLDHTGFKETDITMHAALNDGWLKNIHKIDALINSKYGAANI
jgi:uncharacterized protein YndB with AHSA1/START domain